MEKNGKINYLFTNFWRNSFFSCITFSKGHRVNNM